MCCDVGLLRGPTGTVTAPICGSDPFTGPSILEESQVSTTGFTGSPSSSDGRPMRMPLGAVCSADYMLDLLDAARPVIERAKVVWPKGAPQELRDRVMYHVIRHAAYRELCPCTDRALRVFREITRLVALELRVRESRTRRTVENVIAWVCDSANDSYVTKLRLRPASHTGHVVSYTQRELAREALPKLREAKRLSYRAIARELAIPLITVWRADHDEDGEVPTPRRWSNYEISTLEEAMAHRCDQPVRKVCECVAKKLGLSPDAVRRFWYRRNKKTS